MVASTKPQKDIITKEEKDVYKLDDKKNANQLILVKHLRCLTRVDPNDKLLLVEMLQKHNPDHYVCVTGDQTSDAPAIT
jgi:magnesium-transporting ATPase (P-type)